MSEPLALRDARAGDLEILSRIAYEAKASWGYDDSFMEACRAELTLTREDLVRARIRVAEDAGEVVGFHGVARDGTRAELTWLFVAPGAMGRGVGRALLADAVDTVRRDGGHELTIDADPNAVGFYEHAGARVIGTVPSSSIAGRELPQLLLLVG